MFPTNLRRSLVASLLAAAVVCGGFVSTATAQGNRRGSGGVITTLLKKETIAELKLSDDQQAKIKDALKSARMTTEQARPYLKKISEARTSADKAKFRAEAAAASQKQIEKAQADALAVLTAEQKTQFSALRYRTAGTAALLFEDVVAKLEIKDDQKTKLEDLRKERTAAFYKLPFRDQRDPAAIAKFKAEWDEKTLALLTPDQRAGWAKLTGGTASDPKKVTDSKTPPGVKSETKTAPPKPPVVSRSVRTPVGPYVASFDGSKGAANASAKQPTTTYGKGPINTREKKILSFNFENAPWKIVLEYFAKKAGLTLDITQVPPDTFNYRDANLYTVTEALDVMNGYLLGKKWLLIRRDKFLVAHNLENPVPQNIIPDVSEADLPYRGRNELMRVTFTVKPDVDVKTTAKEVEDMVSPVFGKVLSFEGARRIIVSDIGTNLLRVQAIVSDAEKHDKPEDLAFKAFQCKHIAASDAAKILTEQLDAARTVRNVSGVTGGSNATANDPASRFRQMMASRFGGGRGGRGGRGGSPFGGGFTPFGGAPGGSTRGATGGTSSSQQAGNTAVRVTADARTNNVLVLASARQIKLAEGIVKSIDVPVEGISTLTKTDANKPYFKVYTVSKVDAADATRTLSALMPDVVINQTANSQTVANPANRFGGTTTITKGGWIHIMATAEEHQMVAELIREMDGPTAGGMTAKSIKMKSLDPIVVGKMLLELYQNEGSSAPVINADAAARLLFIRGTANQISQIEKFVQEWESQSAVKLNGGTGPVRIFNVPDADAIAPLLRQLSGNKIRIIRPTKSSPVRDRRTPNGGGIDQRIPAGSGRTTGGKDRSYWKDSPYYRSTTSIPKISGDTVAMATPGDRRSDRAAFSTSDVTAQDGEGGINIGDANAPVQLLVINGQIVLKSDNKEELDKAQQLLEKLIPMVPARTTWNVFYLQAADCTDAATMLEQLYPSSSVSTATTANSGGMFGSLTGGVSQFANTLGNMSGLNSLKDADTLRIVPEPRSNALFVSGPSSKVRDIENMLKVLDATDLPGTLRDRVPRMIPVRYADVNEVAGIVREVYKDFMQASGGAQNQANPLAMLMQASQGGGRGGRGGSRGGRGGATGGGRQQPAQLTLGVDNRTGQLIVSANDTLYNQIEEMVYRLDVSAAVAQRTTRVVRLENAQPGVVTQALTAMYPNISVSVSSNRSGSSSNNASRGQNNPFSQNNNGSNNGGNNASGNDNAARAMMFQQMMRGQQGGNNGSQGGRFGAGNFGRGGGTFTPFGGGGAGGGRRGGGGGRRGR